MLVRSLIFTIVAIAVGLTGASGCSDATFVVRGQVVPLDGVQVAGIPVHGGSAIVETDANGRFEYELRDRGHRTANTHSMSVRWADLGQQIRGTVAFDERIYDGDEFELAPIPAWRVGLVARIATSGLDLEWNPPRSAALTEVDVDAAASVVWEETEGSTLHVPSWLLEDYSIGARVTTQLDVDDRHLRELSIFMTAELAPSFESSAARGAPCRSYAELIDDAPVESIRDDCSITDGDPVTGYVVRGDFGQTVANVSLIVDLGEERPVDRIVLRSGTNRFERPLTILLGSDAHTYAEAGIAQIVDDYYPAAILELPQPLRARYVRVIDPNEVLLTEVSVFGPER